MKENYRRKENINQETYYECSRKVSLRNKHLNRTIKNEAKKYRKKF